MSDRRANTPNRGTSPQRDAPASEKLPLFHLETPLFHSGAEPIVAVSDENLGEITGSHRAVLILARTNCGYHHIVAIKAQ